MAGLWLGMPDLVRACSVCFGDTDEPAAQGAVDAAIVLGGWAYAVLAVGGLVAWCAVRRGRRRAAPGRRDRAAAWILEQGH